MTDCVQWQDECGNHQVGRPALVYARHCSSSAYEAYQRVGGPYCQLIQHVPGGELEWVPLEKLSPYPSEPIPEPGVK